MISKHYIIEMYDCPIKKLDDLDLIYESLTRIVRITKSKVIKTTHFKFEPQGITCIFLISSSHIAFHSYPEYKFATIELSICKEDFLISDCINGLKESFCADKIIYKSFECGKGYK